MKAILVVVGDEILLGQVVDTNAAHLGQAFAAEGLELVSKWTVRDREDEMLEALRMATARADLVIFSGGLGPTSDDLTKPLLTREMGGRLVRNQKVEQGIRSWFKARGGEPGPMNLAQADLPDNCTLLHNPLGTAQGMMWIHEGVHVVALPGVPYEFKHLVDRELIPYLKAQGLVQPMVHHTLMVAGLVESFIARQLTAWESKWRAEGIRLAYLPRPGLVRLRLSLYVPDGYMESLRDAGDKSSSVPDVMSSGHNGNTSGHARMSAALAGMRDRVGLAAREIRETLHGYVYGENELSLEECIGLILKRKGQNIFFAESCTGGSLNARFVRVAGASGYVLGGMVAYSNELKVNALGVSQPLIDQHGAVSVQVVESMAQGAVHKFGSDYAVAISGIAGPTGGSVDKPVGLVCFGIHGPEGTFTYRRWLGEGRELIIERAVMMAMFLLWRIMIGLPVEES
jgi:nicotinamide-nucleotide amidase